MKTFNLAATDRQILRKTLSAVSIRTVDELSSELAKIAIHLKGMPEERYRGQALKITLQAIARQIQERYPEDELATEVDITEDEITEVATEITMHKDWENIVNGLIDELPMDPESKPHYREQAYNFDEDTIFRLAQFYLESQAS